VAAQLVLSRCEPIAGVHTALGLYEEGLIQSQSFPPWLKPQCRGWTCGGTEVPPLQSKDRCRGSLARVSQTLKRMDIPSKKQILLCAQDDNFNFGGTYGRTEVPPLQDKGWCRGFRGWAGIDISGFQPLGCCGVRDPRPALRSDLGWYVSGRWPGGQKP